MDLKELMSTTPESLGKLQFKELKGFVINRLKEITKLIEKNEFEEINGYLRNSPAGDAYGTDHYFIDFNYDDNSIDGIDLSEAIDMLEDLKSIIDKNNK